MNSKLIHVTTVLAMAALLVQAHPSGAENDEAGHTPATMATHYLAIQVALAGDTLADVSGHSSALEDLAVEAAQGATSRDDEEAAKQFATISVAATELARASNLSDARTAFGKLSEALVGMDDTIAGEQVRVAYCPMAKKHWLQATEEIANPYYGASMLRCGQFQDKESAAKNGH